MPLLKDKKEAPKPQPQFFGIHRCINCGVTHYFSLGNLSY